MQMIFDLQCVKMKPLKAISDMKLIRNTLKAVVDFGLKQLLSTAIDQFISINHTLTKEELANYKAGETGETFAHSIIHQLDTLLQSFQNVTNTPNYDGLVSIVTTDKTARRHSIVLVVWYWIKNIKKFERLDLI